MNVWMLLMGMAFTLALVSGWHAGKPAGFVGISLGLLIGLLTGVGGVWSMYLAEARFAPWIVTKKLGVQGVAFLLVHILGLSWCCAIGATAYFITRLLMYHVGA